MTSVEPANDRPVSPTVPPTSPPSSTGGWRLGVAGLLALGLAALILWLGADFTPTTNGSRKMFGLWRARWFLPATGLVGVALGCALAMRSREALFGYLATVFSLLATFGALEGLGRVGLVSWARLLSPPEGPATGLGARAVPNLDVRGVTYQDTAIAWGLPDPVPMPFHYRTDRHGMRNQPDREKADVYLLGDSMLVAALVPHEATVSAQLEQRLRRPVMQVALIGYSPQGEQALFRQLGLDVRGRRVVQFIFEGNDIKDSRSDRLGSARAGGAGEDTPLSRLVWWQLMTLSEPTVGIAPLNSCAIGDRSYTFYWTRGAFEGLEDEIPIVTGALERFAAEIRARGGEYAVVFVPKKLRVLGEVCRFREDSPLRDLGANLGPLRDRLHAWSATSGVALLDLTEPLQAAARAGTVPWFEADTHWNELGQQIAADELARWSFLQ
jgi:hypothetical protein